jgi:3-dehydroquinate synthase
VRRHLANLGLPTGIEGLGGRRWRVETLLAHMRRDKKVRQGRINFVLVRGIGRAFIGHDVAEHEVASLLEGAIAA